jgi:hypothetical protein
VEAEDWCEGVRGLLTVRGLTRASWQPGWRSVVARRSVGGRRERGRRPEVYRPKRVDRPQGAP